jgi:steroid delta-isomerase
MRRTGPVRVAGHEAATPVVVLMGPEDQRSALDLISVMSFDENGKIASMRAFWSMDAIRPATPEDQG